jgi:predicted PurR-regulated permease PerM
MILAALCAPPKSITRARVRGHLWGRARPLIMARPFTRHCERPLEPNRALQDKPFLVLLVVVSLAFAWILWPFYGAIFWATILAILFAPLYARVANALRQRCTLAAIATVAIILLLVILPSALVTGMLLQEGFQVYGKLRSGEWNIGSYFAQLYAAMPGWLTTLLDRFELTDLSEVQQRLSAGLSKGVQFLAGQALNVGQNTLDFLVSFFIMLYLLFFLLRDGRALGQRIRGAVPLQQDLQAMFFRKFADVVRATVKGTIVVAIVQGALGGFIFWVLGIQAPVLWGVVMAFLSLLPAVGTALVWVPVALYLLATGAVWQGVVLIAFGVLVIGLVDNVLRPILVGKDTKMPDYVVLIATLGGIAVFGLNGFVIGPLIAAMFMAAWDVVAAARMSAR